MSLEKNLIYGLCDPRTGEIRYVGKSTIGIARARAHRKPSVLKKERTHKANWIRSLLKQGKTYTVVVLARRTSVRELELDEVWWIAFCRSVGQRLTNGTDGGEGTVGHTVTPEVRLRLSNATEKHLSDPRHRAAHSKRMKAYYAAYPEARERSSLAAKNQVRSPVHMALLHAGTVRSWADPVKRALHTANLKLAWTPGRRASFSKFHGGRPFKDQNGRLYTTQHEAAKKLNLTQSNVWSVLTGRAKATKGFTFKYV